MRKITNQELGRLTVDQYAQQRKISVAVVLDNVRSANNIGSFFRTCDAFGIERLVLCGISATPPSRDIHKTALGAEMSVEWVYQSNAEEAVEMLRAEGYQIVVVEQVEGAVMLQDWAVDREQRYALVFGNEVDGVAQEVVDRADRAIEIPQVGTKHSLNVAVSGGAVLWHFFRGMKAL